MAGGLTDPPLWTLACRDPAGYDVPGLLSRLVSPLCGVSILAELVARAGDPDVLRLKGTRV